MYNFQLSVVVQIYCFTVGELNGAAQHLDHQFNPHFFFPFPVLFILL